MTDNKNIVKEIEALKSIIKSELDVKIVELYYKEIAPKKESSILKSPLTPIIFSALFAILGTILGAWMQGKSNLKLEERKYESTLILKMVETDSKGQAIENLGFLLDMGLIKNEDLRAKVDKVVKDSSRVALIKMAEEVARDTSIQIKREP
jgi:hypothetical protein